MLPLQGRSIVITLAPDRSKVDLTEQYVECVDVLQAVVDNYAHLVPVKILGDLNVKLPILNQHDQLKSNWYKHDGFSKHSHIMNDFIVGNDLDVVDFRFKQDVSYPIF